MPLKPPVARDTVEAQARMFALFVGPGLVITRADLARRSNIPEATLQGWASGTTMPVWAINALADHLPADAMSLLLAPSGRRIAQQEVAQTNWDQLAAETSGLTAEICNARSDGRIDHVEHANLQRKGRALIAQLDAAIGNEGGK